MGSNTSSKVMSDRYDELDKWLKKASDDELDQLNVPSHSKRQHRQPPSRADVKSRAGVLDREAPVHRLARVTEPLLLSR